MAVPSRQRSPSGFTADAKSAFPASEHSEVRQPLRRFVDARDGRRPTRGEVERHVGVARQVSHGGAALRAFRAHVLPVVLSVVGESDWAAQ